MTKEFHNPNRLHNTDFLDEENGDGSDDSCGDSSDDEIHSTKVKKSHRVVVDSKDAMHAYAGSGVYADAVVDGVLKMSVD